MASLGQAIKILPNAGQEQGQGLEKPAAHTYRILRNVLLPPGYTVRGI